MTIRNLDKLFEPESIAVFGASPREGSLGRTVLDNLREAEFGGALWPVNPKYDAVDGLPCYRDVAALPHPPDLAVFATPPATIPPLVGELGARGTRAAVCLTAGLNADNGLRQAMLDAARPHTFRIVGPNCFGLFVPRLGLNASFSHVAPAAGNVALLSQSGALIAAILDVAAARGIGFSRIVSLGDMADVDVADCLDVLAGDGETRAILLYLETVTRADKFMSAARAAARVKPVIVVKSGRHAKGAAAAATHTGALAGADAAADAAFRRAGLLRVTELEELFDAAETLSRFRPLKEARLGILTNGGGAGVLAVDRLEDYGGTLSDLAPETMEHLDAFLPPTWSKANPVDIIGDAPPERWEAATAAMLADPNVDALLALNCPTALASASEAAGALVTAFEQHRDAARYRRPKPVLSVWLGEETVASARRRLRAAGIGSYQGPSDGVRAFRDLTRWSEAQTALMRTPPRLPEGFSADVPAADAVIRGAADEGRATLSEDETKELLAAFGMPVTRTVRATLEDVEEKAAALLADHRAVVVKILSPDITHKSDVGGVVLDVRSAADARAAMEAMLARVADRVPDARVDGVTLQPMVTTRNTHELILGVTSDPVFGPLIVFGAGGTSVEVVADSAVALPPLDLLLAKDLIGRTRISRLLAGYRDRPAADVDALALALVRLSQVVVDCPAVTALDINPLLAGPDGVVALDGRATLDLSRVGEEGPNRSLAIRPYPSEWERTVEVRDGQRVFLRPIRPDDEALYPAFFERLTGHDVRMRMLAPHKTWSHELLARLTQLDYARDIAFVALEPETGALLGVSRLNCDPDRVEGEYAIIVRSDLKGHGIGWALMRHLIAYGKETGVSRIYGDVLLENTSMLAMCRDLGFDIRPEPHSPELARVVLDLAGRPAD